MRIAASPVRVLIFYDEEGWAWWHRARQIQKNMSPAVVVETLKVGQPFNHHRFDLILLFDHPLIDLIRHVPREKILVGSSCPIWTRDAVEILRAEECKAGLVNSLGIYREVEHLARVYCCQNGVDTELFHPAPEGKRPRAWKACWVGNSKSIGNKGLDLIRAACERAGVELLAWDKAELGKDQPVLSQEQVRDRIYLQSSFYVCASEFEGTPNPMLESLACGLPAVSTRVGNAPELIRDGYNGFLADRSVESLAAAIGRLKQCDAETLARNARASVLAGWTWKQQVAKYESMFLELALENRRRPAPTRRNYRAVLWVDAHPPLGGFDPGPWMEALRSRFPGAQIAVACDRAGEVAYGACPGLAAVLVFDRARAHADPAYRTAVQDQMRAPAALGPAGPDLVLNGSSHSELWADLLVLGSVPCERFTTQALFEALDAPLQAKLRPHYSRVLPGGGGPAALLSALGASPGPQPAPEPWTPKPAPLKMLMVAHMFPPHWYAGVEVYTHDLTQALRAKGVDVSVCYPFPDFSRDEPVVVREDFDGIPVFKMLQSGKGEDTLGLEHLPLERVFGEFLDREGFQLVHFHHTLAMSLRMPEVAKSRGLPVCYTLHDFWNICPKVHFYLKQEHQVCTGPQSVNKCSRCLIGNRWDGLSAEHHAAMDFHMQRRFDYVKDLLEKLDVVVSPSRYAAAKFEDHGFAPRGRIEVSQLGLKAVAALPQRPRGPGEGLRFGYLGTLDQLKNVYLLAETFRSVRGNATLDFFGKGKVDNTARLREAVSADARQRYLGPYQPADLPRILSEVDIVVVPSITENYPLVVREAISAGVPVLASRVGGIPEIVRDGVDGLLFDPARPEELLACLQSLVDDPGRLRGFRAALRPVKTMEKDAEEWMERYAAIKRKTASPAPRLRPA